MSAGKMTATNFRLSSAPAVIVTQRFTTADGAQLCYQLRGDEAAPRLLCVQGSMQDMRRADGFLASLALRFHVLVYDHRGMGRSTMDVEAAHYSMAGYAADADALLQHLGWARCHVVGVSFGGMVAQEIALRYPARLGAPTTAETGGDEAGDEGGNERDDGGDPPVTPPCALVLVCTSAGGAAGASAPLHEYARLSDYAFFSAFLRKSDTNYQRFPGSLMPLLLGWGAALLPSARHLDAASREVFWHTCRHLQFGARAKHDTGARLAALRRPAAFRTLVLAGDRDEIAPAANSRRLAELIPDAQLHFFPGGHGFATSNPAVVPFMSDWVLGTVEPGEPGEGSGGPRSLL